VTRLHVVAYGGSDYAEETDLSIDGVSAFLDKYPVTWLDVEGPSDPVFEQLGARFGLHPLAMSDATDPRSPPKVESYDDTLFIVARTIIWAEKIDTGQISVFLGRKFVVTVHGRPAPQLEDVRVRIRKRQPALARAGADFLCYAILDAIVNSYFPLLDRFRDLVDHMEDEIVEAPTKTPISEVHALRRDLTLISDAVRPQRDALGDLERGRPTLFRRETEVYLRGVHDDMIRVLDSLDSYRDVVASLMEVHSVMISNELNRVIKVLTIVFTVTIPLAIVTSAFGMNVGFPGRDQPLGLAIALVLMAGSTAVLLLFLRARRLL